MLNHPEHECMKYRHQALFYGNWNLCTEYTINSHNCVKREFFQDGSLTVKPTRSISNGFQARPPLDLVWKFGWGPSSRSKDRVVANRKQKKEKQIQLKTILAVINIDLKYTLKSPMKIVYTRTEKSQIAIAVANRLHESLGYQLVCHELWSVLPGRRDNV